MDLPAFTTVLDIPMNTNDLSSEINQSNKINKRSLNSDYYTQTTTDNLLDNVDVVCSVPASMLIGSNNTLKTHLLISYPNQKRQVIRLDIRISVK
jgi:hypothetical protein